MNRSEQNYYHYNLVELYRSVFSLYPNIEAMSAAGDSRAPLTYRDVGIAIIKLHHLFDCLDTRAGGRVALVGKNSPQWGIVCLAVLTYGVPLVPILDDFVSSDIEHILDHSETTLLFLSSQKAQSLNLRERSTLRLAITLEEENVAFGLSEQEQAHYEDWRDLKITDPLFDWEVEDERLAAIIYTSGTTGLSKGVMLSHRSLRDNVCFALNELRLPAGSRMISFLPLAHAYGLAFEFLYPIALGCHITFVRSLPTPTLLLKTFQQVRPRFVISVPLVMEKIYFNRIKPFLERKWVQKLCAYSVAQRLIYRLVRWKLTQLFGGRMQKLVIGGAALNHEVEDFFKAIGLPFSVGYGMTECGPLISYVDWTEHVPRGVGRALPTLQVRIDSHDPRFEVGEIQVRGSNVMEGYYKNPAATAQSFTPDGWLKTGDLGVIDGNEIIFIKGRLKSMILGPSGQNIYPEEIEAKLNRCSDVQESIVFKRDGRMIAKVYIDWPQMQQRPDFTLTLDAYLEQLRKQINKLIPAYSMINKIEYQSEAFIKTPSQKIKRYLYK